MKKEIVGDVIGASCWDFEQRTGMKPRLIALNDYNAVLAARAIRMSVISRKGSLLDRELVVLCSPGIPENLIIVILKPGDKLHGFIYEIGEAMKMGTVRILNEKSDRVIPGIVLPGDTVQIPV